MNSFPFETTVQTDEFGNWSVDLPKELLGETALYPIVVTGEDGAGFDSVSLAVESPIDTAFVLGETTLLIPWWVTFATFIVLIIRVWLFEWVRKHYLRSAQELVGEYVFEETKRGEDVAKPPSWVRAMEWATSIPLLLLIIGGVVLSISGNKVVFESLPFTNMAEERQIEKATPTEFSYTGEVRNILTNSNDVSPDLSFTIDTTVFNVIDSAGFISSDVTDETFVRITHKEFTRGIDLRILSPETILYTDIDLFKKVIELATAESHYQTQEVYGLYSPELREERKDEIYTFFFDHRFMNDQSVVVKEIKRITRSQDDILQVNTILEFEGKEKAVLWQLFEEGDEKEWLIVGK